MGLVLRGTGGGRFSVLLVRRVALVSQRNNGAFSCTLRLTGLRGTVCDVISKVQSLSRLTRALRLSITGEGRCRSLEHLWVKERNSGLGSSACVPVVVL